MSLHVLVVARWYPSYDNPGRGSFVADHVAALRDMGVGVTVASFDPTGVRANEATRPARGAAAADDLARQLATPEALARPTSWGARGVAVARLPVILDGSRRHPTDVVDAHARALVPFGVGLHERRRVDVIHAHTGLPDGLAAVRLAERLEVPLLTTEHSSTAPDELADPEARDAYRALFGRGRRVVAVSRSLARELADRLGFEAREVDVLPNAVPLAGFPSGAAADRDPDELLFVGSRKATKGIETLLRAFAEVRIDHPTIHLRLVGTRGTAAEESRWEALADELGVAGALTFEEPVGRAEVAAAMRRATVFVHPSHRETFGMVAAEALASGLPVAATPSGGVEDVVLSDGRFGEIALNHQPSSLAEAIRRVLARRSSFDPVAMRAHVEASFAAPVVAARAIAIYQRMVAAGGRGRARSTEVATPETPAADAVFAAPMVVGLARELAASRLATLPPDLVAQLTVVTSEVAVGAGAAPSPSGRWLGLDPERTYRERLAALGGPVPSGGGFARLLSAAKSPRAELERRDLIARRDELRRQTTDAFLREAWESAGRPEFVLGFDADDMIVVEPLLVAGARLAPGGLRWLVDRWDAAGRP